LLLLNQAIGCIFVSMVRNKGYKALDIGLLTWQSSYHHFV